MSSRSLSSVVIPSISESIKFDTSKKLYIHEYTSVLIELTEEIINNNVPRIDITSMNEIDRTYPIKIAIETVRQMSLGIIDIIDDIFISRKLPSGKIENIPFYRLMNQFDYMYGYDIYFEENDNASRKKYRSEGYIYSSEPYTQEIDDIIATENDNYRSLNY